MIEKNSIFEADIAGYTAEGFGVCRINGMAVFVPGAIFGERCRIKIVKVLKTYAFGRLEEILISSPHRTESDCPNFPVCGGCDFRHMDYEEELHLKAQRVHDALCRIGGFNLPLPEIVPAQEINGYRNKAQFPLGKEAGHTVFGFFRSRSHQLVPLTRCALGQPEATKLAHAVCQWADKYGISIYDENTKTGLLRHVYIRSGMGHHLTVVTAAKPQKTDQLITYARESCSDLSGVVLNYNSDPGNRVLGSRCEVLWGEEYLEDTLLGNLFRLSPLSFYQVNKAQAEQLYTAALEFSGLDGTQNALDLYCGVGTITLTLAPHCRQIVGVEIVPDAVRDAQDNAVRNGAANVRFVCGDAGTAAKALAVEGFKPEVIICDPPRKGLDESCLSAIETLMPDKIVYISCDCASLARDAGLLRGYGWELSLVRAFDLFPRTANVECVCLFKRASVVE